MTEFRDNPAERRFEWEEDGIVSVADYAVGGDGVRSILHVETPAFARGRGMAERLMKALVTAAREGDFKLRPVCGYAVAHFRRHRDAHDVLG